MTYKYKIEVTGEISFAADDCSDVGLRAVLDIVERDLNNGAVFQVGRPVGCIQIERVDPCDSPAVDVVGVEHPWRDVRCAEPTGHDGQHLNNMRAWNDASEISEAAKEMRDA